MRLANILLSVSNLDFSIDFHHNICDINLLKKVTNKKHSN